MTKEERRVFLQEKLVQMTEYERDLRRRGIGLTAGVDEVGRGPLAGPVVAGAVILPQHFDLLGVDDSKKLSEKKREALYDPIIQRALAYGIGIVNSGEIDRINILEATKLAMKEAISQAQVMLHRKGLTQIQHLLIDGLILKDVPIPQTGIVKGDSKSVSIAAASILAKVTRDRMMAEFHRQYPGYGFDRNKGYGTKVHYEGVALHGLCPLHRRTFFRNYEEKHSEKHVERS